MVLLVFLFVFCSCPRLPSSCHQDRNGPPLCLASKWSIEKRCTIETRGVARGSSITHNLFVMMSEYVFRIRFPIRRGRPARDKICYVPSSLVLFISCVEAPFLSFSLSLFDCASFDPNCDGECPFACFSIGRALGRVPERFWNCISPGYDGPLLPIKHTQARECFIIFQLTFRLSPGLQNPRSIGRIRKNDGKEFHSTGFFLPEPWSTLAFNPPGGSAYHWSKGLVVQICTNCPTVDKLTRNIFEETGELRRG